MRPNHSLEATGRTDARMISSCAAVPRLLSIATVCRGTGHKEGFAPGGKVMEGRTRNNTSKTLQALGTCADDRPGQGRPIVSGYHRRERR